MTFLWAHLLWALLAVPALVVLYLRLLRRKQPALLYSNLALVREAMAGNARWRRHMPPLIFLGALVALIVAMARPAADMSLVAKDRTIILAIDVSLSMAADDIAPTRLAAAQAAARKFIRDIPRDVRVGIVAFAGSADVVQVPTRNRVYLAQAIDQLQLDSNTGIGIGILASLISLFPDAGLEGSYDIFGMGGMRDGGRALDMNTLGDSPKAAFSPVAAGSHSAAAIILLTDGRSTIGVHPRLAAQTAADRGVRIFTVGFGTQNGKTVNDEGKTLEVSFDADVLREVADMTRGTYSYAASGDRLDKIYAGLSGQLVRETGQTELTSLFTAAAAILTLVAAALSCAWFPRMPEPGLS
jgi:Ca-activated chloride channel family protein